MDTLLTLGIAFIAGILFYYMDLNKGRKWNTRWYDLTHQHKSPVLPAIVSDYLTATAEGTAIVGSRSWRQVLQVQVEATWAFLQIVLALDPEVGLATADRLEDAVGLVLRRR